MRRLLIATAALAALIAAPARAQTTSTAVADPAAAFMAKNAEAPGVVSLPSGVEYKVLKSGPETGAGPTLQDDVEVNYEVRLLNGQLIDSTNGQPIAMPLASLIPAWRQAIPLMRPGDEWMLWVPPSMGYGAAGKGPVPPNSVLVFKIELVAVKPQAGAR